MKVSNAMSVGLLWFSWTSAAAAAEAWPGVPLPGMESDPVGSIIPKECSVNLVNGETIVDLAVGISGDSPRVELDGPVFGWVGASDAYPDRQFPELSVRVDGKLAELSDHFEAFVGATNITNLLRAAKMDPWAITRNPPVTPAQPANGQILKALKNLGAIEDAPAASPTDGEVYLAKWVARRRLTLALDSAPAHRIELRYYARPGVSSSRPEDLVTNSREKTYCLSAKPLKRFLADESLLRVEEYTLPVGIDGRAPRSVSLAMASDKTAARPLIFACGPHGKAIAAVGRLSPSPVEVDDTGVIHVLTVAR